MTRLVIDTCLGACQVGLFDGDRLLAGLSEPMERGHQERLAPMAAEVMARAGAAFADIDRLAVTVGPGSFTGLRVGLAFARGLALATGAPLVGIGTLAALAASVPGAVATAIDARRGLVYAQAFGEDGQPLTEPDIALAGDMARRFQALTPRPRTIVGPGAALLGDALPGLAIDPRPAPDLAALGRLAATQPAGDVRPLYLRAPDAKPLPT